MNYAESLDYLYHAKQAGAEKRGLDNITELMKRLGNPEARFPSVHIAGTNGKGSVCAFMEYVARSAGYKTGLFTSPYLERFTERIQIGEREIPEDRFALLATQVRAVSDSMVQEGRMHPTFFELITACCFIYFAQENVDLAVVETGMGGLTDATNVLAPLVSVITTIGIDHAHALGNTVEEIAGQKAGIIKPGVPCVLSAANGPAVNEVIRRESESKGSKLIMGSAFKVDVLQDGLDGQRINLAGEGLRLDGLEIKLLGSHQAANAATAVLAAVELRQKGYRILDDDIRRGLANTCWPGRLELLRREPPVLIDGAHNPQAAETLAENVLKYLGNRPVCLVMGAMADKEAEPMVQSFSKFATNAIVTLPPALDRPRYRVDNLVEMFRKRGVQAVACPDWQQALSEALNRNMAIVVAGSLYLAGSARTWLRDRLF